MKTVFSALDKRPDRFVWRMSFSAMLAIAGVAVTIGNITYLEPFFLLPIVVVSWYGSKKAGVLLAFFSTVTVVVSRQLINAVGLSMEPIIYDGVSHIVAYTILAILITNFRSVHRVEVVAADTDSLTNLLNPRGFYAELANELLRSIRYNRIFSLAYIDIDNFKSINDSLGHSVGDALLKDVANCLKSSLRATDTIARLGGDEYACLLPETEAEAAKKIFLKVRQVLTNSMQSHDWPVSFSAGMVTFEALPGDIKEAIAIADDLMYSVKKNKKDNTAYEIWHGGA